MTANIPIRDRCTEWRLGRFSRDTNGRGVARRRRRRATRRSTARLSSPRRRRRRWRPVPARPTQRPRGRRAGAIARPPARGLCAPGCSRVLLTRAAHAAGAGRQEDWAPARGGGGGGESEAGRATAPRAAKLWQRGAKLAIGRRASAGRAGGSDAARDRGDGAGGADDGRLQQPTSSVGGAPSADLREGRGVSDQYGARDAARPISTG